MKLSDYIPNIDNICKAAGQTDKPLNPSDLSASPTRPLKLKIYMDKDTYKYLGKPSSSDVESYFGSESEQ